MNVRNKIKVMVSQPRVRETWALWLPSVLYLSLSYHNRLTIDRQTRVDSFIHSNCLSILLYFNIYKLIYNVMKKVSLFLNLSILVVLRIFNTIVQDQIYYNCIYFIYVTFISYVLHYQYAKYEYTWSCLFSQLIKSYW